MRVLEFDVVLTLTGLGVLKRRLTSESSVSKTKSKQTTDKGKYDQLRANSTTYKL